MAALISARLLETSCRHPTAAAFKPVAVGCSVSGALLLR
jgi:hypothetical protein